MKHKKIHTVIGVLGMGLLSIVNIVGIIIAVILGIIIASVLQTRKSDEEYLAHFHSVYSELNEKYSSVVSLEEELECDKANVMYCIKCDFTKDGDCFSELVDVQRKINNLINARKGDYWFDTLGGYIDVQTDCQRLRFFYDGGSMTGKVWIKGEISDDYNVLWDAFPENEKLYLIVIPDNYSDELKSEIEQKYEGRDITVKQKAYY